MHVIRASTKILNLLICHFLSRVNGVYGKLGLDNAFNGRPKNVLDLEVIDNSSLQLLLSMGGYWILLRFVRALLQILQVKVACPATRRRWYLTDFHTYFDAYARLEFFRV